MDRKRHHSTGNKVETAAPVNEGDVTVAGSPTDTVEPPRKKRLFKSRPHYFLDGDIVWVHTKGYPFWPAEVVSIDVAKNQVTAKLFCPPPALVASERPPPPPQNEAAPDTAHTSFVRPPGALPPTVLEGDVIVTCSAGKTFYFSRLASEAEIHQCVEARLQRKEHDVSAYEAAFTDAVRKANSLLRTVLDPNELPSFSVTPVGIVYSLMRTHTSAPRQPHTGRFEPQTAVIVLRRGLENALRDLAGFEYVWVVFQFNYSVATHTEPPAEEVPRGAEPHRTKQQRFLGNGAGGFQFARAQREGAERSSGFKTMVVPPRDVQLRGVFATRSPHRPNSIGLSCCRVVSVHGLELHIADHDLLHGTPVLDIKPYLPFCDAHPDARAGWVTELDASGTGGADHRSSDAGFPVHRVYDDHRKAMLQ